jgi:polyhydroxyalkanoate synthesis regulator protein
MAAMPGFEAMRKQQEVFMQAFMGGLPGWTGAPHGKEEPAAEAGSKDEELAQIKRQLAELQKKLSKL